MCIVSCSRLLVESSGYHHASFHLTSAAHHVSSLDLRRCVKLRRILSPQAESPNDCITSDTVIALLCRVCSDVAEVPPPGVAGGSYELVVCALSRPGDREMLILDHSDGELASEFNRSPTLVSIQGSCGGPACPRPGDDGESIDGSIPLGPASRGVSWGCWLYCDSSST